MNTPFSTTALSVLASMFIVAAFPRIALVLSVIGIALVVGVLIDATWLTRPAGRKQTKEVQ